MDRERAKGIEPSLQAWEARVLPLNYARTSAADGNRPPEGPQPVSVSEAATRSAMSIRLSSTSPQRARINVVPSVRGMK